MPSRRLTVAAALCCVAAAPQWSRRLPLPWNETGHQVIARTAWAELTPGTQKRVAELLRAHPRYRADLLGGEPDGPDPMVDAEHAFGAAAVWPDVVRSLAHPMHHAANHPHWHYLDLPLQLEGQPVPPPEPDAEPAPHDAVAALAKCTQDLGNEALPAADRAQALCWVLHLVADLHQPLHACTLYSPQFPHGDKGSNDFVVLSHGERPDSRTSLHALWDAMLGNYATPAMDACLAEGLAHMQGLARADLAARLTIHDPADWARESHAIAVESVYLGGKLEGITASDSKKPPALPKGYLAAAETVAARQAAVAAHRLADLLEATLARR